MKIRTTNTHHVADARALGGGEKRFDRTAAGKRQAQEYLRRVQAEHNQKGAFTNPNSTPLFADAVAAYLKYEQERARRGELGSAHVDNKRVALDDIAALTYAGKRLASMRLGDLRAGVIKNDVIPQLFKGRAYATAQKKFAILKHMMQWAVESEILMNNPALVRLPKKPQAEERAADRITKAAITTIIAHAAPKYRLAIKFAAYTGLRVGEQLALTWDDVDLDAGLVRVSKAVKKGGSIGAPKTKGGVRSIPLTSSLLSDLLAWKLAQPIEQRGRNLVFPTASGSLNNVANLRNRGLTPACKSAGVEVIRWHDLRHFFASVLLFDLQESDAVVTSLMGHHSIAFTHSQYGHWMPEARRDKEIATRIETALTA